MQLAKCVVIVFLMINTACTDNNAVRQLEEKYFATLDNWVERGGPISEIQELVVKTCSKLVMLDASPSEKIAFTTTQREEFDFRVDVCTKITVNRVHPQPEFEKKELIKMICDENKVSIFYKL